MTNILDLIKIHATFRRHQYAICSKRYTLTYQQLEDYSDNLACYLKAKYGNDRTPIIVYGHKHPFMVVCFLACVKAGHAYCPIDTSVPWSRTKSIIDTVNPDVIFAVSPLEEDDERALTLSGILKCAKLPPVTRPALTPVSGDETFYIIFTSGSTGTPKGVQISADCLNHYLEWACELGIPSSAKSGYAFLNQAPFSFDLSVMDLYTCLACGGTLHTLDKDTQSDYRLLFRILEAADIKVWVSTPSFADLCLADNGFTQELMPSLAVFLFCGETLTNRTADALLTRFPDAAVINTYGPTESTVALTQVHVTRELNDSCIPLPVGSVKPGSLIEIHDAEGNLLPDGTPGEIILLGDTVSTGYYQQEELTKKAFFHCIRDNSCMRGYRTGDEGYLKNGQLYYCGRIDLQVKLHGYRIELEDIEQNLLKVDGVAQAVVTPNMEDGHVKSLTAHLVYRNPVEHEFRAGQEIKAELKAFLPDYMIPKKIRFLSMIPMTMNGKCDRKRLGGQSS